MAVLNVDTPLGKLALQGSSESLERVQFADTLRDSPSPPRLLKEAAEQVKAYFEGEAKSFELPIAKGTPFQEKVWQELKSIPYGETVSYRDLASRLGKPQAMRAVAKACGANPLVLFVPCHRVVRTNGGLGGFSAGLWRKKSLLVHERTILI